MSDGAITTLVGVSLFAFGLLAGWVIRTVREPRADTSTPAEPVDDDGMYEAEDPRYEYVPAHAAPPPDETKDLSGYLDPAVPYDT